eukprot:357847-Chlamydomonas_euryale.AAC.5
MPDADRPCKRNRAGASSIWSVAVSTGLPADAGGGSELRATAGVATLLLFSGGHVHACCTRHHADCPRQRRLHMGHVTWQCRLRTALCLGVTCWGCSARYFPEHASNPPTGLDTATDAHGIAPSTRGIRVVSLPASLSMPPSGVCRPRSNTMAWHGDTAWWHRAS